MLIYKYSLKKSVKLTLYIIKQKVLFYNINNMNNKILDS